MSLTGTKARPITGVSLASCIGNDLQSLVSSLKSRSRGVTLQHRYSEQISAHLGCVDHSKYALEAKTLGSNDSPLRRMVFGCMRELDVQTNVFSRYKAEDIGLFLGTTTAGLEVTYGHLCKYFDAGDGAKVLDHMERLDQHGVLHELLRQHFPIRGFGLLISTACSAGAAAIAEAKNAVELGLCKVAIAGGFDILTGMTIYGFDALQVLDHAPSQPFTKQRKGMNLSEGGALVLIESEPKIQPIAWMSGSGASSDIYHMTHPDPCGTGMQLACQRALSDANLTPEEIGYLNPHGTGTVPNDAAETLAMTSIFGDRLPLVSTKAYHGHALAGAGALEAAICIAALRENRTWQLTLDMDSPGIEGIGNLRESKSTSDLDSSAEKNKKIRHTISNSFGFGGNNISLIISSAEAGAL